MIAADTSVFITLTTIDLLDIFLTEFDVHTTETVGRRTGEHRRVSDRDWLESPIYRKAKDLF